MFLSPYHYTLTATVNPMKFFFFKLFWWQRQESVKHAIAKLVSFKKNIINNSNKSCEWREWWAINPQHFCVSSASDLRVVALHSLVSEFSGVGEAELAWTTDSYLLKIVELRSAASHSAHSRFLLRAGREDLFCSLWGLQVTAFSLSLCEFPSVSVYIWISLGFLLFCFLHWFVGSVLLSLWGLI